MHLEKRGTQSAWGDLTERGTLSTWEDLAKRGTLSAWGNSACNTFAYHLPILITLPTSAVCAMGVPSYLYIYIT